jgi:phosphatidylinositol alpha-1,6-mannosyltransferase
MPRSNLRVLFISRAHPPTIGGLELQNWQLSQWLGKKALVSTLANTRGRRGAPFFLLYACLSGCIRSRRYDVVLLGDLLLAPVAWVVRRCSRTPVVSVVHGLDVTFSNCLYQRLWVRRFAQDISRFIAVGNETIRAGVVRGLPAAKFTFVPNGVDAGGLSEPHSRAELEAVVGRGLAGRRVLVTVGRLTKRKGVAWFVDQVMPLLDESVIYIVAGQGRAREEVEVRARRSGVGDRVVLLGDVSEAKKRVLLNASDVFVQPNIAVPGDIEGFGISVLEAGACGLPVVASRLEGLKDAVRDGANGVLVESGNARAFQGAIDDLLGDEEYRRDLGHRAREYVSSHCTWQSVAERYIAVLMEEARNDQAFRPGTRV